MTTTQQLQAAQDEFRRCYPTIDPLPQEVAYLDHVAYFQGKIDLEFEGCNCCHCGQCIGPRLGEWEDGTISSVFDEVWIDDQLRLWCSDCVEDVEFIIQEAQAAR